MNLVKRFLKSPRLFQYLSWGVTVIIVLVLFSVALIKLHPSASVPLEATPTGPSGTGLLVVVTNGHSSEKAIARRAELKTIIPTRQAYAVVEYTVSRGDSLFSIADDYNIEPETLYWANFEVFDGSPDNLKPGDVLRVPPVNGIYYEWQEGDTFESVGGAFEIDPEEIKNWPGNNIDLTDPEISPGTYVLLPGATKDDQPLFITTVSRESTSVGLACGGGYIGRGYFTWPTANHYLTGYDYGDGGGSHRGIDIAATEGTPVYAADNGVVTVAGWNANGYGNVIQIDHGNGFVTLYAHLSSIGVQQCQSVMAGGSIGAAGNTGNSLGSHLHFEIRYNGVADNPWFYLP